MLVTCYVHDKRVDIGGKRHSLLGRHLRKHAGTAGGFFGAGDPGDTLRPCVVRAVVGGRTQQGGRAVRACAFLARRDAVCWYGAYGRGALPVS